MSAKKKSNCRKCDGSGIIYPDEYRPDAEYLDSAPGFCDCTFGEEMRAGRMSWRIEK